jgi:hypothetical protein
LSRTFGWKSKGIGSDANTDETQNVRKKALTRLAKLIQVLYQFFS